MPARRETALGPFAKFFETIAKTGPGALMEMRNRKSLRALFVSSLSAFDFDPLSFYP